MKDTIYHVVLSVFSPTVRNFVTCSPRHGDDRGNKDHGDFNEYKDFDHDEYQDLYEDYEDQNYMNNPLELSLNIVLIVTGLVSNNLTIAALSSKYSSKTTFTVVLRALAVADILNLLIQAATFIPGELTLKDFSHIRVAITRCDNAINGKIITLSISMIYSHCTRNAEM